MIYVCIYSGADGSYRIGLSDFIDPTNYSVVASRKTASPLRLARAFAFPDSDVAAAFYARISNLPFRWLEQLVVHGIPEKAGVTSRNYAHAERFYSKSASK